MPKTIAVIGPPGTGKTSAAMELIRGLVKGKTSTREIAYLTFTKAAAEEGISRILTDEVGFGLEKEDFPYFRTIHSLAFRGMCLNRKERVQLLSPAYMRKFSKETGFDGKFATVGWEDLAEAYQRLENGGRNHWDQCLDAYSLSRIVAQTPEEFLEASRRIAPTALRRMGFLEDVVYQSFVQKYEAFKKREERIDFTDMLAYALLEMPTLDEVKYVIVDEVQDCAPVLFSIVYRLFREAKSIWLVGDANQAIYSFAGADSRLFLDRIDSSYAKIILRKTHRFGQEVVDFSTKVIERAHDKYVVDLIGVPNRKHRIHVSGDFEPAVEPMLILHRHVMGCQAVAEAYIQAGLPFRNERGKDPLGSTNRIRAFQTIEELANGGSVPLGAISRILDLMPSTTKPTAVESAVRLVVHGAKKKAEEGVFPEELSIQTLVSQKVLTEEGAEVIRGRQYNILDHSEDLEYYRRVTSRGHTLDSDRLPIITTIHGAKGRQAPKVVVFNEMGRKCWTDPDTEHRLAYVAATRTQGEIEICNERTLDWADTPYNYPTEDTVSHSDNG